MSADERLRLKTLADQDQEWAEGAAWYHGSDKAHIAMFFDKVNEGTRESINKLTDEEFAVLGRLAVLSLVEICAREEFGGDEGKS